MKWENQKIYYFCRSEDTIIQKMEFELRETDERPEDASERALIDGLKRGDNQAYKCLYDKHFIILCGVAYQYVGDTFLAKSVVSDVIFHLWEIRDRLSIRGALRKYLVFSVRNRCLDYLKSERYQREVSLSASECENRIWESDNYPLGKLLENELEQKIGEALEGLPSECKRVFFKSRFENKKYEAISKELGISVPTVKYHMKRAVELLYKALGKYLLFFL